MNRIILVAGGLLNLALAIFKIAMPYLFRWKEAMGSSQAFMQTTVYAENLGISLLLLFFAYMSIFHRGELLETDAGRIVLLAIGSLWAYGLLPRSSCTRSAWMEPGGGFPSSLAARGCISCCSPLQGVGSRENPDHLWHSERGRRSEPHIALACWELSECHE